MKYIILGKSLKSGKMNNDSSDLSEYFELGWEVVGSRMDIIRKLNNSEINKNETTFVTTKDRIFLYSSFYDKVLDYEKFSEVVTPNDIVEDWTKLRNFSFLNAYNNFVDKKTKKYFYLEQDHNLLFNGFDLTNTIDLSNQEKFVVLALRYRDHNNYKNANNQFFVNLVSELRNKSIEKIYVVGFGTEEFCSQNNCIYVERLSDFVKLIKNENCLSLISQSTGTVCLAFMCSETKIILLDHSKCSDINGDNAVLGGKCIQLCKNGIIPFYTLNNEIIPQILQLI